MAKTKETYQDFAFWIVFESFESKVLLLVGYHLVVVDKVDSQGFKHTSQGFKHTSQGLRSSGPFNEN
jgi:hypothetical protein